MQKYYHYIITLDGGKTFDAKVNADDVKAFNKWIDSVPGISGFEETKPVYARSTGVRSGKTSKLATARLNAGLTQTEVADRMGVKLYSYQRWEYGECTPRPKALMRIGEILGVEWTSLVE